jgi:hypothetical protein
MDGIRHVPAAVRVTGPPNSNFLVGYPGISATMVRLSEPSTLKLSKGLLGHSLRLHSPE